MISNNKDWRLFSKIKTEDVSVNEEQRMKIGDIPVI